MRLAGLVLLFVAFSANADVLTLVCENEPGPGDLSPGVARIQIDLAEGKIVTPHLIDRVSQLHINEDYISFLVKITKEDWQTLDARWLINRHTGTLYLNLFGVTKDNQFLSSDAKGQCQEPNPIF